MTSQMCYCKINFNLILMIQLESLLSVPWQAFIQIFEDNLKRIFQIYWIVIHILQGPEDKYENLQKPN